MSTISLSEPWSARSLNSRRRPGGDKGELLKQRGRDRGRHRGGEIRPFRAHAERWVGSVRRECLDRILIVGRRHLQHVLSTYVAHYNQHPPHRALAQRPPLRTPPPPDEQAIGEVIDLDRVRCRDLLGGLIHEYELAA